VISVHEQGSTAELGTLSVLREAFYDCLTRRADALFELCDSVLCADGPVCSLVGLSLAAEHRRGHGALYDAVNAGRMRIERLRRELAGLPLPRDGAGRIVLAVDISNWLRPDAATAADRSFCHVYGRGKSAAQLIPGWPYSFIAALEPGRSSWTSILDVVRLGPLDDLTEVSAAQVRQVVARLRAAGQWAEGDPPILVVFDAGYDVTRLGWLLTDVPVVVVGRLKSDRVFHLPVPARSPGQVGRPGRHGPVIDLDQPARRSVHRDRHQPLRQGVHRRLGPGASTVATPRRLGHPRGATARRGGHPDPAGRGPAAWGPPPQTGVAVGLGHRRGRHTGRPAVAGLPPPV
jgi:hypothetical protein